MNRREKILATVIGLMLGFFVLWVLASRVSGAFTAQQQQIGTLKQSIRDKEQKIARSRRAVRRLKEYETRSLPPDRELARSLYQAWLLQLVERAGYAQVNVTNVSGRGRSDVYFLHTFSATGRGNLEQLTRLLFDFYAVDHLHRLRRIAVKPIRDSKDLDLSFTIEALSLPQADHLDRLNDAPAQRLKHARVEDYVQAIVGRNIFAPANRPPKLASLSSQRGSPNRTVSFTVKADDPDKLDQVTYSLAEPLLPQAKIDRKSGQFQWTPKEKGDFSVTVVATDDGLPVKTDQQTIKITVADPPPEPVVVKPKKKLDFDNAKHAYLTAIIEAGGRPELWLTVRTTGEVLKLHEGDKIAIGSVEGVVRFIGETTTEIETDEKKLLISLGESLLQGQAAATDGL